MTRRELFERLRCGLVGHDDVLAVRVEPEAAPAVGGRTALLVACRDCGRLSEGIDVTPPATLIAKKPRRWRTRRQEWLEHLKEVHQPQEAGAA